MISSCEIEHSLDVVDFCEIEKVLKKLNFEYIKVEEASYVRVSKDFYILIKYGFRFGDVVTSLHVYYKKKENFNFYELSQSKKNKLKEMIKLIENELNI